MPHAAPNPASPTPLTHWHTLPTEAACTRLQTSPAGLSTAEAERRLAVHGPNELQAAVSVSPWKLLFEQFQNILIVILLLATVLSAILGHTVEAIAIGVIVLFAVGLGFIQEYRADRALQALRRMAAPLAHVLRDGQEAEVPARTLVPGDVLVLRAGDKVPADARLLEAYNLQAEEAALTGESTPVEKKTDALDDHAAALGDRINLAFAGTAVTYGRGRALVVATGMETEFGKIAQLLETVETGRTPLQENLDKVGQALARAAFVIVLAIVAVGLFRGQPFGEMLIFGLALAVAVVPEALPAVVTISLAIGVQRMVQRHALMRRLPAVETLGSTTVICSDKTGTLTKDEMTARRVWVAGQLWDVSGAGYEPRGEFACGGAVVAPSPALQRLLQAGVLASDAQVLGDAATGRWRIQGDPTEGALVVLAAKAGLDKAALDSRYPRVDELPFTSESKRMTTFHAEPQGVIAYAKGAPEVIVEACARLVTPAGDGPLLPADRAQLVAVAHDLANQAFRVLAVAEKPGATRDDAAHGLTLLGLVALSDLPRPEVPAAIRRCQDAGIKPVMITGDHPLTAEAVARELGLLQTGRIVTGTELETLSDEDLARSVEEIQVYARVSPAHKLRVVAALQQRGHIVAMTGDGVNDAPALKKADIGIAMGIKGTDVTREAAAMTLTDDNFASIVAAVEEGRGIFGNIKKYLMYLLSSNIGEIGLMAGVSLTALDLPLTAVQILYVNLATDGLPALALAVDPPDPDLMRRPPRNPRRGIFTRPVVALMLIGGIWSTLVNLGLFVWADLWSGRSLEEARTMTFVSLVLIQFFKAYSFRSEYRSIGHHPLANRWLNWAIVWELLMLSVVVYVPWLQVPFGTFSLSLTDWAIVLPLAASVVPVLEVGKALGRRGWLGNPEP